MDKNRLKSREKMIVLGKFIEKNIRVYEALMGVISLFEVILFVRGMILFSMSSYKHYLYLFSYIFLFVVSISTLIYLLVAKIDKNDYKTLGIVMHLYSGAIVFWSLVISYVDMKVGNMPIVYLTVIVTIASIVILEKRFYISLTVISFVILIVSDGLTGFDYFSSSGDYINFFVFLTMAVAINIRLYNASVKEFYINEDLNASVLEERNRVSEITLQTIRSIINTIDAKDKYTGAHSQRVAEYSTIIAKELKWSEEQIKNIHEIALLHDIGKIGVPDSILNHPEKLSEEEYEEMKQHTVIGGEILKDLTILPQVSLGAKYHHEWYNGNGYPSGLKGEEIPIEARIISVADAFDAMNSNRVYRPRLTSEKIIAELCNGRWKQFDPVLVDLFLPYAIKVTKENSI